MDTQTFDTITLPDELLEGVTDLLTDSLPVDVLFLDGKPVTVELPANVELKITQSPEGMKGDTANNPTKEATVETGRRIQVPLFIKEGDVVKIDTRTGKYVSRV